MKTKCPGRKTIKPSACDVRSHGLVGGLAGGLWLTLCGAGVAYYGWMYIYPGFPEMWTVQTLGTGGLAGLVGTESMGIQFHTKRTSFSLCHNSPALM